MQRSAKKAVLNRIHYAVGHLEGIAKMVREDVDPAAILQQTRAVSSTLTSIDTLLLSSHFKETTARALDSSTKRRLNRALRKLVEIYTYGQPRNP